MVINESEQVRYISADQNHSPQNRQMARQTELPKKPLKDLMPCAKIGKIAVTTVVQRHLLSAIFSWSMTQK